jgi:proteasome beta subunit
MDMVRLFQLQLEHYEKVEGVELSLEGKANQLSAMVRAHLPAAMQGLAVVPLFAGFDTRRRSGRLFQYDVTGGRYEETGFATTGSGSLHAGTVIKLGYRDALDRGATDVVRGIYPTMATITADGFTRVEEGEISDRFASLVGRLATPESTTAAGAAPSIGGPRP